MGTVLTWVIRKLIFEKNFVPCTDLDLVKNQLHTITTEKAVVDSTLIQLKEDISKLHTDVDLKVQELEKINKDYTKVFTEKERLEEDLIVYHDNENLLKKKLDEKENLLFASTSTVTRLEATITYKERELTEQTKNLESLGKKFEQEFTNLAQKILDEKAGTFGRQQESNLKLLLEPFKAEIVNFKKEFAEKHSQEAAERNSMKGAIGEMVKQNQILSDQANSLSKALSFQAKQQGSWGEEILESILQHCGLQEGIHYYKQYSSNNEEGTRIRPDFVINCPDNRCVVIDSKVSLTHYTSYCAATEVVEQERLSKSLLSSIKSHIDGLSAKKYPDIANTLDSVIMFMPVESAYILAMHNDQDLWRYAYSKRVLLISSSNLIATIKLISDLWQRDAINKNAKQIADKAGRLYDKMVGFVENMKKVGDSIGKANETWKEAYGQLYSGHGNMINQAHSIKLLGAKTGNKKLPEALLNDATFEEQIPIEIPIEEDKKNLN